MIITNELTIKEHLKCDVIQIRDIKKLDIGDTVLAPDCLDVQSKYYKEVLTVLAINKHTFTLGISPIILGKIGWYKINKQ